jgi:hypothetical protein
MMKSSDCLFFQYRVQLEVSRSPGGTLKWVLRSPIRVVNSPGGGAENSLWTF